MIRVGTINSRALPSVLNVAPRFMLVRWLQRSNGLIDKQADKQAEFCTYDGSPLNG